MKPLRFLRTARYLTLRQAFARLRHRLWMLLRGKYAWAALSRAKTPALSGARLIAAPEDRTRFQEISDRWMDGTVEYLGVAASAHDWQAEGKTRLWRYERQYHSELVALSARAQEELEGPWLDAGRAMQDEWASAMPPFRGDAWEPYPTARRILSWAEAVAITPQIASSRMASRLAVQLTHLRRHLERHLRGNHLLCDAAALVAGGALLAGPEGDLAMRAGSRLLEKELKAQTLDDGGFAERSVQYHALVMRDSMLALELSRTRSAELRPRIEEVLVKMAQWLRSTRRTDGSWPLVNDAVPQSFALAQETLARAQRLQLYQPRESEEGLVDLAATGWASMTGVGCELFFDTSAIGKSEQPGHSHNDALAYELRWYGLPVVSDSGVTTYEAGPVREFERSAAAHATVSVDGAGIDEVWSSFRVGGRGRVQNVAMPTIAVDSRAYMRRGVARSHSGFEHERTLIFWPGRALLVFDHVSRTRKGARIISHVPLDPIWSAAEAHGSIFILGPGARGLQLHVLAGELEGLSHGKESPRDGFVGQGFGNPVPRTSVRLRADRDGLCVYSIVAPGVSARQTPTGFSLRVPGAEVAIRLRDGKPY